MTTYRVRGMTCGGCVSSVTRVVQALDPKLQVKVELEPGELRIDGDHDAAAVQKAVERAGFEFGGAVEA